MASVFVIPAGNCLPIAPANIKSVAWPRTLGPMADRATLITAATMTAISFPRRGRRWPRSRLAEGPKSIDF